MALKPKPRSEMDVSDCSANEDLKVDILDCEEVLCQSSSSSFGDSMCARGDDDAGFEAQSMLSKDYPLPESLGLRKKKLTDEWRRFCQPLMWRCKWLELKAKEIESQARAYDKEVRSYYLSKKFDLEKSKLEGFNGKSIPFRDQTQRMNVFKRGRRKRMEETTDVASYISSHNVFSYAEKRKPTTLKAQYPDLGFGTGRKADDETEADCFVSESNCSDNLLAKILCKINEAQDKAKRLKKRVDQTGLTVSSVPPQTVSRSQIGKHHALVEEELSMPHTTAHNQREATKQIGRQRISADHTNDLLIPQAPPTETGGQFLNNNSPLSSGGLRFPTLEDLLMMDEPEMNGYEAGADKDLDDCFMKLMKELAGETEEEEEEEEDPTPVTKKHKTSH